MAKAIFKVFFKIIKSTVNIVLAPINAMVVGLFPDFSAMISYFNLALNRLINGTLGYFFNILPPHCKTLVALYLGLLVSYYTISITLHAILKVYTIIKNIKIW